MPTEYKKPIPVGTKVILKMTGVKGIKFAEGVFKADFYTSGFHDGSGRGPYGFFWFASDHSLEPYDVVRKKTGFSQFISRIEGSKK